MMSTELPNRALAERYRRLRVVAQRVVDEAEAVGNPETPMCAVPPHRIKVLRRELEGRPQPTSLATMGS
jgi:hypothetical protein